MTRSSSDEPRGPQALTALTELARDSVRQPSTARLDRGLQSLSASIAADSARRRGVLRWSLVGASAAVLVAILLAVPSFLRMWSPSQVAPLSYRIEGGSLVDGGYLRDSGHGAIKLSFAEGTEFVLMPGTRGRLRAVDSAGARFAIEQGTASFQVTPRSGAKWMVEVGPFLVTVKGTVFTVRWDAASERFELRLRHGNVIVSGPTSSGDIALRAGQRLVVNLPKKETLISEPTPEEEEAQSEASAAPTSSASGPPREQPAMPPETQPEPAAPAEPPPAPKVDGDNHRWTDAVAAGHFDKVLLDVEQASVKSTLESASSEDLFAVATAARYRRRTDLAREALLAVRRRFAGSGRALDAAFLLGRLEESSARGTAHAVEWYNEYLARAPNGTYASEALGRKMIMTSKLEGASRARSLADEYLRRFPNGSYAGSARALLLVP